MKAIILAASRPHHTIIHYFSLAFFAVVLALAVAALGGLGTVLFAQAAQMPFPVGGSATKQTIDPPLITIFSHDLANNEIFYVGGTATYGSAIVVVYLQNENGETLSGEIITDTDGAWFYSHPTFLKTGSFTVWTQLKVGDAVSPPSPQIAITVVPTAIQIGGWRMSYEQLYLWVSGLLVLAIIALAVINLVHWRRLRRKEKHLLHEVVEVEKSVTDATKILKDDINKELAHLAEKKKGGALAPHDKAYEEKLLKDLELIESYLERGYSKLLHLHLSDLVIRRLTDKRV